MIEVIPETARQFQGLPFGIGDFQQVRDGLRRDPGHTAIDRDRISRAGQALTQSLQGLVRRVFAPFQQVHDIGGPAVGFLGVQLQTGDFMLADQNVRDVVDQPGTAKVPDQLPDQRRIIMTFQPFPDEPFRPAAVCIARQGPAKGRQAILRRIEYFRLDGALNGAGQAKPAAAPAGLVPHFFFAELLKVLVDRPGIRVQGLGQFTVPATWRQLLPQVTGAHMVHAVLQQKIDGAVQERLAGFSHQPEQVALQVQGIFIVIQFEFVLDLPIELAAKFRARQIERPPDLPVDGQWFRKTYLMLPEDWVCRSRYGQIPAGRFRRLLYDCFRYCFRVHAGGRGLAGRRLRRRSRRRRTRLCHRLCHRLRLRLSRRE